jgi:acetyltransferase-like isoleucine patch superfamily enzyme
VRSHIVIAEGSTLDVGNDVFVGYGASISCDHGVSIGDGTRIGSFAIIMDSDFHIAGSSETRPEPSPIAIGHRVRIGDGVTVLRGTVIGDEVVVEPGSVVWGTVPDGEVVAGTPSRRAPASR